MHNDDKTSRLTTVRCFESVHYGARHDRRARQGGGIADKRRPWPSKGNGMGTADGITTWRAGSRETKAARSILCQGNPSFRNTVIEKTESI